MRLGVRKKSHVVREMIVLQPSCIPSCNTREMVTPVNAALAAVTGIPEAVTSNQYYTPGIKKLSCNLQLFNPVL